MLDQPNARSSHTHPTPRGGGVAFVIVASAYSCALAVFSSFAPFPVIYFPLMALPLSIVGFYDDLYNLPVLWRYAFQLFTALAIILVSPLATSFSSFSLLLPLLIVAVTAIINFTNFMDGIDGLVAGCMAVLITTVGLYLDASWPVWVLVGALLGFLFWNWSPAKVFMGDTGSTFLGAIFAALVLQASTWVEVFCLLLVATPLLSDALICVVRRLLAGQRVFQAHRLHLFQRLHQAGWSHTCVSSIYIAGTIVLAFSLLYGGFSWVIALATFEMSLGFLLDQRFAVPFSQASRA